MTPRAPALVPLAVLLLAVAPVPWVAAAQERVPGERGESADPVAELERTVATNPGDADLHVLLGLAYWRQDDAERALAAFERAVQIAPRSAEAHNWLGVALMAKSEFPAAIAALRKAIALDPSHGRAHTNLGSALSKSGDFAEAAEVFRTALALEPNSLAAHMNLGMALRDMGDLDAGLVHLRRVAEGDPDNAAIQYELGQTLRQSGDLAGAIAAFERALEIDPERREAYYALGMALKQQGARAGRPAVPASPADALYRRAREAAARSDLSAAREDLARAISLDEQHADSHTLLGFVLGQQGELASAVRHLRRAVALRPDASETRYNLGVALWYSGAREGALAELKEAVTLDPAASAAHAFLGTALRESGDLPGARGSLQRAIALAPSAPAVYVDLGVTFLRLGDLDKALGQLEAALNLPAPAVPEPDWDAAITGLRRALEAEPAHAEAYNTLGLLLGRTGAPGDEVIASFREAIRLRPDYAAAHNNLGLVLIQSGSDADGIAALREAVRLAPEYAEARTNLGAALTPTDVEAAVRELEEAVRLAPGSVKARFNLAVAYGASPAHGAALEIEQLRKVIDLAPGFARGRLALGKALLGTGDVSGAVAELREAVRLEPQSGEGNYQLGLALARAGQQEEAAAQLKKGRELVAADDRRQNAALEIADGRAALERGELEDAAVRFRRAATLHPDSPEPHTHLALALERQGNVAAALAAYRKAAELNPGDTAARQGIERLTAAPPRETSAATVNPAAVDDPFRIAEIEEYIRSARFKDAEPLLAEYIGKHPKSSWGWYALGYAYFAQQKIGESIKALARSLQLDIRNAEAHKILGRNLMIIGRFDAAQLEFEQAIRFKPDSAESYYNLGKLFSIQDNWEPARKAFEAALRIQPGYIEAIDALGFTLEALGHDEEAVAMYKKAIALNAERGGTFSAAHVNMSAYLNRTGEFGAAAGHARRALDLEPESDRAWFQKARADEREGRLEEAVEALNRAIVINPRASSYYYVLAGVYRQLNWMDESRRALEEFKRLERESNDLEERRRRIAREAVGEVPVRE